MISGVLQVVKLEEWEDMGGETSRKRRGKCWGGAGELEEKNIRNLCWIPKEHWSH